eukprot:scaffold3396_cov385-Prasinococcus_capsulatus_cf.AAC.4
MASGRGSPPEFREETYDSVLADFDEFEQLFVSIIDENAALKDASRSATLERMTEQVASGVVVGAWKRPSLAGAGGS